MALRPQALLFDLDGTLLDSAPDLAGAANDMRLARGLPALQYGQLRPHAGSGARGMLGQAFAVSPGHDAYPSLRDEFHDRYEARMLQLTQVFPGVHELADVLQRLACPWGIVTNKSLRFCEPLARALQPLPRAGVLVGGDSTPFTKPHPQPLLEAARRLGVVPEGCAYVGDDPRDMQAAHAAGMQGWAAAWGYLGVHAPVAAWGAHQVFAEVRGLIAHLHSSEVA